MGRPPKREVVHLTVASNARREVVVALCNDTTVWMYTAETRWAKLPEIPQIDFDEADIAPADPTELVRSRR